MKPINNQQSTINNLGFTLIELLVVISIIGILATLIMANFMGVRERARDARRKSDIREIQNAIQMYYSDYKKFPSTSCTCEEIPPNDGCPFGSTDVDRWSALASQLSPYINPLPVDPINLDSSNNRYVYGCFIANSNYEYEIETRLENASDSDDNNDGGNNADIYERGTNLIYNVFTWY
ncbi:MAG: prepilin-type N-terminal cleavage/methylation domain-containing protein [bacterium]|nr:prepilin-type N-terminal cleavage/methylation domain-containing protein [bacterium]